jgi:hypothetical protein
MRSEMATEKPVELDVLRSFSPLDGLKRENLHALAKKTRLQSLDSGRVLFKEGESDKRTVYLVGGEVELRVGDRTVSMLRAGTPEARIAIAPGQPRRLTARALSDITYVSIDSDLLDVMITWDQTGSYEVSEISGGGAADSDDWMTVLLQDQGIPPDPAREPPGALHAHAARRLPGGRGRHQAGRRWGLLLRDHEGQRRGHARDPR